MSRGYSDKFLLELSSADLTNPGIALAKACVDAKLPALYVAAALEVSRMALYAWFRGKPIRKKNLQYVEALIKLIKEDTESGRLPAKNTADAKAYIEDMIGKKIN